jgi:hypothetical protein
MKESQNIRKWRSLKISAWFKDNKLIMYLNYYNIMTNQGQKEYKSNGTPIIKNGDKKGCLTLLACGSE